MSTQAGFSGGESVATKNRKEKQAEIERLHEKTFKAWLNSQLRVRNIKIEHDLKSELQDGLILINVVEILSGKRCEARYHTKPAGEMQRIENVTMAIEFAQQFVPISIAANDILQGNMRLILGMIWRLILTFKVESQDEESQKLSAAQRNRAAKKKLLDWCIEKTKGHNGVNITDFGASWYDGLGFCALIHAFDPALIDFDSLSPENAARNLEIAFDLAEKHLDIPRLLDPEDITAEDPLSRPDEQCFMTYLSEFPIAFLAHQEDTNSKKREEEARARAAEEAEKLRLAEEAEKRRVAELQAQAEAARKKAEEEEKKRLEREKELKEKADADLRAAQEKAEQEKDEAARKAREDAEKKAKRKADKAKRKAEEDEKKRSEELAAREAEHEAERLRLEEECRRLRSELDQTKGRLIGKLKVNVIEARGLAHSIGKVDPYCVLFLERQKEKTKTIKKTLEPKWEADFEFYVSDPDAALEVTVFDWNLIFSDDFLGKVIIPIKDLTDGDEVSTWYKLEGKKKKDKVSGEIHLSLLYRREN